MNSIFLFCVIFHLRCIVILVLDLLCFCCKQEATCRETGTPHTQKCSPQPWCGSCSLPADPWRGFNGDVLRLMLYLQHVSICGESIHNQASRDIQKPKLPRSISITISKPVMVTNIILQMENHKGSGPVGNVG